MTIHLHRFGPREFGKAEEAARDAASDGTGVVHIVEVFDEETVRNVTEDVDMGPLYVVLDAHLAEFLTDRDASVQESFGINPDEQEDDGLLCILCRHLGLNHDGDHLVPPKKEGT